MALQRFSPVSPDPDLESASDMTLAKFGHLNALIDTLNSSGIAGGSDALPYLYGMTAQASGMFSETGDAQISKLVMWRSATLSSGSTAKLSLDGTGVTKLLIPHGDNRAWGVEIKVVVYTEAAGGTVAVGDSFLGKYILLFKKVAGVSSIVGINTATSTYDASLTTAGFLFTTGIANDLEIKFNAPTTATNTTFRIVAEVTLSEVGS